MFPLTYKHVFQLAEIVVILYGITMDDIVGVLFALLEGRHIEALQEVLKRRTFDRRGREHSKHHRQNWYNTPR